MLTDGIISIFYDGPRFAVIEEYTCAKRCSDFDCVVGLYGVKCIQLRHSIVTTRSRKAMSMF